MSRKLLVACLGLTVAIWSWSVVLQAGEKEDRLAKEKKDMEAMQEKLNQKVLDLPFNSGKNASNSTLQAGEKEDRQAGGKEDRQVMPR